MGPYHSLRHSEWSDKSYDCRNVRELPLLKWASVAETEHGGSHLKELCKTFSTCWLLEKGDAYPRYLEQRQSTWEQRKLSKLQQQRPSCKDVVHSLRQVVRTQLEPAHVHHHLITHLFTLITTTLKSPTTRSSTKTCPFFHSKSKYFNQ